MADTQVVALYLTMAQPEKNFGRGKESENSIGREKLRNKNFNKVKAAFFYIEETTPDILGPECFFNFI